MDAERGGDPPRPVAAFAVVASAGGLDAISRVLRDLPPDLGIPVLVAQHLGGQGSQLVEILGRRIALPVRWAEDGAPLRPGQVIVCPPRMALEALPDRSCSLRPAENIVADRPLSVLLASLADSFGSQALAVVLTGMGQDAADGAVAVREAGGLVLVQDEDTAEQPAMPLAVVHAGAADRVLPLHEIGPAVLDVVAGHGLPPSRTDRAAARALFAGPGEVRRLARELDWAATPLGPVTGWPAPLRTALRLVLDSPGAMCLLWGQDQIQLYNDSYREILGGKHPAALGRANRDCWPELSHRNEDVYARVLAGESVGVRDALYPITRGGALENAWFDVTFVPVRDEQAAVGGILCTVVDRTAGLLHARRLRVLHAVSTGTAGATTWRAAFETALAALAGDGADVLFAVGYAIEPDGSRASLVDAVGVRPGGPMAPGRVDLDRGSPGWPLAQAVRDGEPLLVDDVQARFEGVAAGPDALVSRHALVVPLRDPGDGLTGVVVLGVSPRLPLDAPYREFLWLAGREVAARMAEARGREIERRRAARLAELDRAKTEFFSNVSHEFRTPLTLMLAPLDELFTRAGELPADLRDDVALARRNARRLLRLVGTLLDFSTAEAGRMRSRPTDLSALTAEIAGMFRVPAEQAGLELRVDAPPLARPVRVDPEMWEKIIANLLSNALKFTFAGHVSVTVRELPQHVQVEVVDTGVGIPDRELPHLFKRFHRVRGTRARTYEGAGIGLALVDELVRRHHGRIRVRSAEGQGSTFTIWLPLHRRSLPDQPAEPAPTDPPLIDRPPVAASLAEEAASWTARRRPPPDVCDEPPWPPGGLRPPAGDQATVLVVDDSAEVRDYVVRLLGAYWRVGSAGGGTDALAAARRDRPDLILAGVLLPDPDGLDLLSALRHDPALRGTPVILLTDRADEEAVVQGLLAGANDYVSKPFSARELVARVAAQIELARVRRQNRLGRTLSRAVPLLDDSTAASDPN